MRLIPARAGNTWYHTKNHVRNSAHPRSRGEHWLDITTTQPSRGSSPLARGTRRKLPPSQSPHSAHPRSRGEHDVNLSHKEITGGSSPLARGTPSDAPIPLLLGRLIPARAGNTLGDTSFTTSQAAHPRSRGEHILSRKRHMRYLWLIPARAGNTFIGVCGVPSHEAHPRSRGEHHLLELLDESDRGSSPLARGTP